MPRKNRSLRLKSLKSIRKILSSSKNNDTRTYLLKEEMEEIVKIISGKKSKYKSQKDYMENNLLSHGWVSQITIDSHPSLENTLFIEKALKAKAKEISDQQNKIKKQNETIAKIASYTINSSKQTAFNWQEALDTVLASGKVESLVFDKETISIFLK